MGKKQDEKSLVKNDELDEVYSDEPEEKTKQKTPCTCCRCNCAKRYLVAILSSIGFVISFGIRCNMGVAIVTMVKNATSHISGEMEIKVSVVSQSFH